MCGFRTQQHWKTGVIMAHDDPVPGDRDVRGTAPAWHGREISWDDVRAFLVVAVHGSLNKAGLALAESQPTIGRRIQRLEQALGVQLMARRANSIALLPAGSELLRAVTPMSEIARDMESAISPFKSREDAPIRLTSTTSVTMFLTHHLSALRQASTPKELLLLPARRVFDLTRGEADIALRMRQPPKESGLLVQKIAVIRFSYFGVSRDADLPLIMPTNSSSVAGQYAIAKRLVGTRTRGPEIDEMHLRHLAVKSGAGIGQLPCFLGDADPALMRSFDDPSLDVCDDLFLVRHERTRGDRIMDALSKEIVNLFRRHRRQLGGWLPSAKPVE